MRSVSQLARLSRAALAVVFATATIVGCDCDPVVNTVRPGISVTPKEVTFGNVAIGTAAEQLVDVLNTGRAPLTISTIGFEGEAGPYSVSRLLTTTCSGQPRTAGMNIAPAECARFAIRFTPTAKGPVEATVRITSNAGETDIAISGVGATPGVQICVVNAESGEIDEGNCTDYSEDPAKIPSLNFGNVAVGDSVVRKLRVRNLDEGTLVLTNVRVSTDEPDYSIVGGPFTGEVAGTSELDLEWTFAPQRDGPLTSEAVFPSNDQAHPEIRIPLVGEAQGPRLCFDPETGLDFGDIAVGLSRKLSLTLRNCGTSRFDITQLEFFEEDRTNGIEFAFQHVGPPAGVPAMPLSFAPGAEHKIDVTYTPHRVSAAGQADLASINVRSGGGSGAIPVVGRGATPACDGRAPTADLRVFKGTVNITANPSSDPLTTVTVDATASTAPGGGLGYVWRLVRQPTNGTVNLVTVTNPGKKNLFLELAGEYEVEVIAKDQLGCQSAPKTVIITAVPRGRVHIQLTWPEFFGDVDLHFVGPGGQFYNSQSDCYYASCKYGGLDWGSNNTTTPDRNRTNDPTLDIDELWGRGPENINHDLPFDGIYKVVTHYYCSRQSSSGNSLGAVNPVLKVFVNGVKVLEETKRMTQRDAWEGAIITVSGNGSNITATPSTATVTKTTGSSQGCTTATN